jgi:hypothetical protein
MTDTAFFHERLADDETILANLKKQRYAIDRQIEALEQMVQIAREVVYHEESEQVALRAVGMPRPRSKRGRIHNAINNMLAEYGTMHRSAIFDRLINLGLISNVKKDFNYVSTILSVSRGFVVTDHNGNWSLATKEQQS